MRKSVILAAVLWSLWALFSYSVARGQALSRFPITSCASCSSIVIRGTNGVQQTTTGQTQLSGLAVTWTTPAARAIEVFNQGTLPANGPVNPYYCYIVNSSGVVVAPGTVTLDWTVHPLTTLVGCVIAISTNPAGCSALTVDGATNRIDLQAQSP